MLRLTSSYEILSHVVPVSCNDPLMTAFHIRGDVPGESAQELFLVFNANDAEKVISLPDGTWDICINGTGAGTAPIAQVSGELKIPAITAMVLVR